MPALVCALVATAALAAGSGAVAAVRTPVPGKSSALVRLSTHRAGARPVAVTISFRTELQCGRLMSRAPLRIRLPRRERMPRRIAAASVRLGGRPAGRVTVSGRTLVVEPAPPAGAICNVIGEGVARVAVTRAGGLGNPAVPGTYPVVVRHGGETFRGTTRIR